MTTTPTLTSLDTLSRQLRFRAVHGLLLDAGDATARISHVLVDRYGLVLVMERGERGRLKGKSDDAMWSANPEQGRSKRFANPLRDNDLNRQVLQRVLIASGRNVPAEYVQSLVVFEGADLTDLRLNDIDSMRVVPTTEVHAFVTARYDFPPNLGALEPKEIDDLVSLLSSLDRSHDPEAVAWQSVDNGSGKRNIFGKRRSPTRSMSTATRVVFDADMRYPDGSQPPRLPTSGKGVSWRQVLMLSLLLAVVAWLALGGGLAFVSTGMSDIVTYSSRLKGILSGESENSPPAANGQTTPVGYDVPLALQRLKEADPDIHATLATPQSPTLSVRNGLPTYTWTYFRQQSPGNVAQGTVAITLDGSGRIVGADIR